MNWPKEITVLVISTFTSPHISGFNNAKIDQFGFNHTSKDVHTQMEKRGL